MTSDAWQLIIIGLLVGSLGPVLAKGIAAAVLGIKEFGLTKYLRLRGRRLRERQLTEPETFEAVMELAGKVDEIKAELSDDDNGLSLKRQVQEISEAVVSIKSELIEASHDRVELRQDVEGALKEHKVQHRMEHDVIDSKVDLLLERDQNSRKTDKGNGEK